jgi:hypothetical protein
MSKFNGQMFFGGKTNGAPMQVRYLDVWEKQVATFRSGWVYE